MKIYQVLFWGIGQGPFSLSDKITISRSTASSTVDGAGMRRKQVVQLLANLSHIPIKAAS
jgi:hypothetical protein